MRVGRDLVRHAAGLEADGERAAAGIVAVRAALAAHLDTPTARTQPVWLWLTTASAVIGSGVAETRSDARGAVVFQYSPTCDRHPGLPAFEKTIAQELSGLYLDAATRRSPAGWTLYGADVPGWFVQGAEEWVTTRVHERPDDLAAVAAARASEPPDGAIRWSDGVRVENDYRDGEALVAWLVLAHGADVVDRLLACDAPTFEAALIDVTGLDGARLVAGYEAWRRGR